MSHDRSLAAPAFPDDDGSAYPELAAALGDDTRVLGVLGDVRVFVPVVATLGGAGAAQDGPGGGAGPRAAQDGPPCWPARLPCPCWPARLPCPG